MFWSTVTVIVAEFIIIAFLIPLFAAIIFGGEIARYMSEARHERARRASRHLPMNASGPVCAWEPHKGAHAH